MEHHFSEEKHNEWRFVFLAAKKKQAWQSLRQVLQHAEEYLAAHFPTKLYYLYDIGKKCVTSDIDFVYSLDFVVFSFKWKDF